MDYNCFYLEAEAAAEKLREAALNGDHVKILYLALSNQLSLISQAMDMIERVANGDLKEGAEKEAIVKALGERGPKLAMNELLSQLKGMTDDLTNAWVHGEDLEPCDLCRYEPNLVSENRFERKVDDKNYYDTCYGCSAGPK